MSLCLETLLLSLTLVLAPGCGPSPCPARFTDLQKGVERCTCTEKSLSGPVSGLGIYSADSSICASARHAGPLTSYAGVVMPIEAPGCAGYLGEDRHGIKSSVSGAKTKSFYFATNGDGKCAPVGNKGICPATFDELQGQTDLDCTCTPNPTGTVEGTGVYTAKSNLCAAALHAGAVTAAGGKIKARRSEGCKVYLGSEKNGVTSKEHPAHDESIYFPGRGDGTCPPPPIYPCPERFDPKETDLVCLCPPNPVGEVWGTGVYAAHSNLCAAARHAGASAPEGGRITARRAAGCAFYKGSASHGVASAEWAAYDHSIFFPGTSDGRCPTLVIPGTSP